MSERNWAKEIQEAIESMRYAEHESRKASQRAAMLKMDLDELAKRVKDEERSVGAFAERAELYRDKLNELYREYFWKAKQ